MSRNRQRGLALLVFGAVVSGMAALVLAFNLGAADALDSVSGFVARWFFTIFCVTFAIVQGRVYLVRSRQEARLARHVPPTLFAFFTWLWVVLAVAGLVYGVLNPGGRWKVAGWVTITVVICAQLFILGGFEQRSRSEVESDESRDS